MKVFALKTRRNLRKRISALIWKSCAEKNGTRRPSRDKAIQLAFGFGLDVEETQGLLRAADKSVLYPRIKRDAAIIFAISRKMSLTETQIFPMSLGMSIIGE